MRRPAEGSFVETRHPALKLQGLQRIETLVTANTALWGGIQGLLATSTPHLGEKHIKMIGST